MLDCSITCLEDHPTNRNWFICLVYWYNVQGDVVEILQGICLDVAVLCFGCCGVSALGDA